MQDGLEKFGLGFVAIALVGVVMIVFTDSSPQLFGIDLIPAWMGEREVFGISALATLIVPWVLRR